MSKKAQKHNLSFVDAFTFLKNFRYKPRNEWTKDERTIFKICNFIVLSKKRINIKSKYIDITDEKINK